jgi:hypothetical protein
MIARLDHLVVAARDLVSGAAWLEKRLGVALSPGGVHPRMGTHNRVLRLGDGVYLELIAVDPAAPPPGRPRWFGLDEPALSARLAGRPHLVAWAANTDDLDAAVTTSPFAHGSIEEMTRGDLAWRITIPQDGRPVEDGAVPTLIAWPPGVHPTKRMPASGCALERLTIRHGEPARIRGGLARLGLVDLSVRVIEGVPSLAASITTPTGRALID